MLTVLRSRIARVAAAILVAGSLGAGVVLASHTANHVLFSGGALVATKVATNSDYWGSSSINVWEKVTGTTLTVTVPSGATRLLNAHFMAESTCYADASWCSVRIVARKGSGTLKEFRPHVGTDFAYDTPDSEELYEGNSVDRSLRLGAGTWSVWVQAQVIGGTTGLMVLDDWHFEVDVFK